MFVPPSHARQPVPHNANSQGQRGKWAFPQSSCPVPLGRIIPSLLSHRHRKTDTHTHKECCIEAKEDCWRGGAACERVRAPLEFARVKVRLGKQEGTCLRSCQAADGLVWHTRWGVLGRQRRCQFKQPFFFFIAAIAAGNALQRVHVCACACVCMCVLHINQSERRSSNHNAVQTTTTRLTTGLP